MTPYVADFGPKMTEREFNDIRRRLATARTSRAARDIVIANGGTFREMPRPKPPAALVRRARARAR